jgi:glycosyltransferase involved in cell wall biosynthesis
MRVLTVIPGLSTDGGAERSLVVTAAGLLERGYQLHLVVLSDRQGLVPALERMGAVIHDLSGHGALSNARNLRRLIRQVRPDVVHASLFDATLAAQIASIGSGVPVLVTLANTSYGEPEAGEPDMNRWKLRLVEILETVLGRVSRSWYHAVTPAVAQITGAALRVPPGRVLVGERGRDPERFAGASAGQLGAPEGLDVPPDAEMVLAVGRQDRQKGYEHLIAEFDRLASTHPEARLVIAGREGSASARMKAALESTRNAGSVHLLGHRDDIAELMARADVVVCASWREGAAGALIEAMACARPIVSVDIAGLDGVLVDEVNAIVVPRDRLAEGIGRVLDDAELARRIAAAGRRTFEDRFTTARSVDRMIEIYETVAAG